MKNNKRGITVTSIVVYVILFFMFTTATIAISSRINKNLFNDRGLSINVTAINKLEYNLLKSSEESSYANVTIDRNVTTIEFSNNDRYDFDLDKHTVYKNGGKLVGYMSDFEIGRNGRNKGVELDVTLNKYTNNLQRKIVINNEFNANYIDDGLIVQFDGINNAGIGTHRNDITVWKELTENIEDASLNEAFITNGIDNMWLDDGLLFPKSSGNSIVALGTVRSFSSITMEVTLEFLDDLGIGENDYVNFLTITNSSAYNLSLGTRKDMSLMNGSGSNNVFYTYRDLGKYILPNIKYTFTFVQDNSAKISLYINGKLVATQEGSLSRVPLVSIVQTYSDLASYISNSVRIYNRVLTEAEIQTNYKIDRVRFGE